MRTALDLIEEPLYHFGGANGLPMLLIVDDGKVGATGDRVQEISLSN